MYNVKLPKFEGPLDLLLELIEERRLDIAEVSIAKVAVDYLEYVRSEKNISLEHLAEFVSIASKIILIKSRNILPTLEVTPEEEKEIKDLEEQLKEYKKYKEVSVKLSALFGKKVMFSRDYLLGSTAVFLPPKNVSLFDLKKHFQRMIDQVVLPEKIPEEAVRDIITLEEKINELEESLKKKVELSFSQIQGQARDRVEVIVSFLALLELVKQRLVSVEQNKLFEEITIRNSKHENGQVKT